MAGGNNQGFANLKRAFSVRNFRVYQSGRMAANISTWMYKVAIGWIVWELTGSAAWLGVFGFLDQVSAFFVMPLAGAYIDRVDQFKFLRVTQMLMLGQAILLSVLVLSDAINIWGLAAFTLAYGVVNAAQQPASTSVTPALVPREYLSIAYGISSMVLNGSRFIGPMIGGYLIHWWGAGAAIACNALGAALFSIALSRLRMTNTRPQRSTSGRIWEDVRDGVVYTKNHKGLRDLMLIIGLMSLLPFSIDQLLPSLADGVFGTGAQGLALMMGLRGIGSMLTGYYIARKGEIAGTSGLVLRGIAGIGVTFIILSLVDWFWAALVCMLVIGFTITSIRNGSTTLMQFNIDPTMRGRVSSIFGLISMTGPAVGSLVIGVLADYFGIMHVLTGIGVITLGVAAWGATRYRAMAETLEVIPEEETEKIIPR